MLGCSCVCWTGWDAEFIVEEGEGAWDCDWDLGVLVEDFIIDIQAALEVHVRHLRGVLSLSILAEEKKQDLRFAIFT